MPATFESSNGVHPGLKNGMNLENALKIVSLHLPSIPAPKNAGASLSTLRLCDFATLRYIRGTQRREGANQGFSIVPFLVTMDSFNSINRRCTQMPDY